MTADFDNIETFLAVVDAGSFTAAAEQLGSSKASASRRVSLLERELGVRLLERSTRSLRLTEAGSGYADRARRALADLQCAAEAVTDRAGEVRGHLRVTAPVDLGPAFADIVAEYLRAFPKVTFEVSVAQRRVDLIAEGFDLALRAGAMPDSSLIVRRIATSDLRLYAAPSYLAVHGQPCSADELRSRECVLFRARNGRQVWTLQGKGGSTDIEVRGALSADGFSFCRHAIEAGLGVGRLPSTEASVAVAGQRLAPVLPDLFQPGGHLYIVYPSAEFVPAKVRTFVDFCVEHMTGAPWRPR